jgi:hypothetical protein
MRALSTIEGEEVAGGGWIFAIVGIAIGFGAGMAAASMLAAAGAKNLEHMEKHKEIPTFGDMVK